MNVLLVDDQREIVESLKRGIRWDTIPVEQAYTACSAKEAKLVLTNFHVDVLVSDIEMPEENGLSLCLWAKEHFPELECIFLTSHADFSYAKEAIRMGGFDYILQPVKYEEIEQVLRRVKGKISSKEQIRRLESTRKLVMQQRNTILDAILSQMDRGRPLEADQIYRHYGEMFRMEFENCRVIPVLIQILRWKRITREWEESLVRMTLGNIAEELFAEQNGKAGVACLNENCYWMFLCMEKDGIGEELWRRKLQEFYQFTEDHMDFSVGIYPGEAREGFSCTYGLLKRRAAANTGRKPGIFWEDQEQEKEETQTNPIQQALNYIRKNLSKNISRADVARQVHLNEEYFSRLFKQETGDTFKEYVLMEKMKEAQKLLAGTKLSVSIIASKVGYDNFSHFSKMFKKATDRTPQEYRKEHQGQRSGADGP